MQKQRQVSSHPQKPEKSAIGIERSIDQQKIIKLIGIIGKTEIKKSPSKTPLVLTQVNLKPRPQSKTNIIKEIVKEANQSLKLILLRLQERIKRKIRSKT